MMFIDRPGTAALYFIQHMGMPAELRRVRYSSTVRATLQARIHTQLGPKLRHLAHQDAD